MKLATILSAALFAPVAVAKVAKFAAGWKDQGIELAFGDKDKIGADGTRTKNAMFKEKLATIKSAQNKEILINLSGMVNLLTFTEAKGKVKEGEVTSVAEANVKVQVVLIPTDSDIAAPCTSTEAIIAAPGNVTMVGRKQTLAIDVDLEAETDPETDLKIKINGFVKVGLELDTTAAHSFQFLAYDLVSDKYDIYACWSQAVRTSIEGADETYTPEGAPKAAIAITKRMLIAESVRAVKTDDTDIDVGTGKIRRLRN